MKQPEENTLIPVVPITPGKPSIPYEDEPQHNGNGFCGNMGHECHENKALVNELEQARQYGEVTDQEANKVYRGKTLGGW